MKAVTYQYSNVTNTEESFAKLAITSYQRVKACEGKGYEAVVNG